MSNTSKKRDGFSGKLGFVLSAAGASVGLGNIWRFPYLAAKYGGGIFLLVYIVLALTFGYTMIIAETAIGRMTKKTPASAFKMLSHRKTSRAGGWVNAIIPFLLVPYYCAIGGWVVKYLFEYFLGHVHPLASDDYFNSFLAGGFEPEICFLVFSLMVFIVIISGVKKGIERVSKVIMPILLILAFVIVAYTMTMKGALEGVKYFLIPNFSNFSWVTVVTAMGQMFYSLSIAMGILITFGSYMSDDVSIENATENVEIFDTGVAILAGLMIIPAVFAFSGGDSAAINAGPSLMFISIPKVLESLGVFAGIGGVLFFALVFFAALTSAIALMESPTATLTDEFGLSRKKASLIVFMIMIILGSLSSLGYGPLEFVKILGMHFLDFFDFIINSILMPLAALGTCYLVIRDVGVEGIAAEMEKNGHGFKRKRIFAVMIRYLSPVFLVIIFLSSVANALGIIKM